jgi:hypothetical protein
MVIATKLTKLTHKIAIQLHLLAKSCTIHSSRSRRPVRKLLDTHLFAYGRIDMTSQLHFRFLLIFSVIIIGLVITNANYGKF